MSYQILVVGDKTTLSPLIEALSSALHEVSHLTIEQLDEQGQADQEYLSNFQLIAYQLGMEGFEEFRQFSSRLIENRSTRFIGLVACPTKGDETLLNALLDIRCQGVFLPANDSDYDRFGRQASLICHQMRQLAEISKQIDILGIETKLFDFDANAEPDSAHKIDCALLLSERADDLKQSVKKLPYYHFFRTSVANAQANRAPADFTIIDTSIGIDALKIASRLSAISEHSAAVIFLIDANDPDSAATGLNIGVNDFFVFGQPPALFKLQLQIATKSLLTHRIATRLIEQQIWLSVTDELTGLYNRRYLNNVLSLSLSGSHKKLRRLGVCMIDIDFFKKVNDEYGHLSGDEVLKQCAWILQNRIRRNDSIARWGGEEFVIVFNDIEAQTVQILCDRLRKHIQETPIILPGGEKIFLTISIGISYHDEGATTAKSLVNCADYALYAAKDAGRNRVMFLRDTKKTDSDDSQEVSNTPTDPGTSQ